jgi:nucleotide-binding universal stress UspA family protein
MPTHILAAIDFSPVSDRVIELAADLALTSSAALTVLHVAAPEPGFVGYDVGPQYERDRRASELRDEHRRLQEIGEVLRTRIPEVRVRLRAGATVETILAEADASGAGMIIVGAHRHARVHKLLLGSVSSALIREATCPVTVVPPVD